MKDLCLISSEQQKLDALSTRELDALMDEAFADDEGLRKRGHDLVSDALQPMRSATTVRLRHGQVSVTDSPFARDQGAAGQIQPDRRQGTGRRHPGDLDDHVGASGQHRGAADLELKQP